MRSPCCDDARPLGGHGPPVYRLRRTQLGRLRLNERLRRDQNGAMSSRADHWDTAYDRRGVAAVSWYERLPRVSLEILSALDLPPEAPLIDVGGGASTLAAELVARGHTDVSVLDISEVALRHAEAALGSKVTWIHADVLKWRPERQYTVWHDRALLHFFTDDDDREAYVQALNAGLAPGGFAIIGAFAADGPDHCSGLPVQRYTPEDLGQLLSDHYAPRVERYDLHETPSGVRQPFTWLAFQRVA